MNLVKIEEVSGVAKAFADSGLFADIKSASQAVVKIMAGAEMGIPPFAAVSGVHLIQGKAIVGAGLLAARVQGSVKYKYRVTQHSDIICSITFYEGAEVLGISSFSIEEARKAGTKNLDKFPRNMLFARAISNGVKWFTPDLFGGPVYVPGEIDEPEYQPEIVETTAEVMTDIQEALTSLASCKTLTDLTEWKGLFGSLTNDINVKHAAKAQYSKILNKEA